MALVLTGLAVPVCALAALDAEEFGKSVERLVAYALGTSATTLPATAADSPATEIQPEPQNGQRLTWHGPSAAPPESTSKAVAPTELQRPAAVLNAPRRPIDQQGSTASPMPDTMALARELQRELSRVGCYSGQISGLWTPRTRQAMHEFMSRANASLPVDKPDEVLLALVRSFPGQACGVACAQGESLNSAGQCVPGIVAQRTTTPTAPTSGNTSAPVSTIRPAPTHPHPPAAPVTISQDAYPEERMALAGPRPAEAIPAPTAKRAKQGERPRHARTRTTRKRPFGPWIFSDAPTDSPFR